MVSERLIFRNAKVGDVLLEMPERWKVRSSNTASP
jgi:hypothetical protein